jgi:hypothetical protein
VSIEPEDMLPPEGWTPEKERRERQKDVEAGRTQGDGWKPDAAGEPGLSYPSWLFSARPSRKEARKIMRCLACGSPGITDARPSDGKAYCYECNSITVPFASTAFPPMANPEE